MKKEALKSAFCRYKESLELLGTDINYGQVCYLSKAGGISLDIESSWGKTDLHNEEQFYDFVDTQNNPCLFLIDGFSAAEVKCLFSFIKDKRCRVHTYLLHFSNDLSSEDLLKIQSSYRHISIYSSFISFNDNTIIIYPHA